MPVLRHIAVLSCLIAGALSTHPVHAHPGHEGDHIPLSPGYEFYESNPNQHAYESIAECAALFKTAADAKGKRVIGDQAAREYFEKLNTSYMEGAVRVARKLEMLNPVSTVKDFYQAKLGAWKKRWEDTDDSRFNEMRDEHVTWLNYCEDLGKTYFLHPRQ